ncbi:restriction endonuclease subunit S [Litorivita sp. NS0012-18]|uniref:restriction endonuclease subunit S n=1 Tax=Litorivita sp. NS0012-18 TaxID=3127655 RepID=UPI003106830D
MSEAVTVPVLRFPEFEGAWVKKPLNNAWRVKGKRNVDNTFGKDRVLSVSGEKGIVNQIEHLGRSYAGVLVDNYHVVEVGDIVYTKSPLKSNPFGIIKANKGQSGIVSTLYAVYEVRVEHDSEFWDRYFELDNRTNHYLKPLVHIGAKNDMKINNERVLIDPVSFPSLQEQKKIAAFLGVVDAKLAALRDRVALLERYKRGLMQALFSQSLRFTKPDGTAFPDWEEKAANELFVSVSNKKHTGDLPILAITQEQGAVLRENIDIDIKATAASILSYKIVERGDFIISLRSFQGGIEYSKVHGICSPAYTILKPTLPISDGFFMSYFKDLDFISRLSATVVGIREGKQISYSAFGTLTLPYPHPDEQTKIAEALSAMDAKIAAVADQVAQMEQFKKGLLQQMFV